MNKEEILFTYTKDELRRFLETDYTGLIVEIMDSNTISMLKNDYNLEEKLEYIMQFSTHREELLSNSEFLDLLLSTDTTYYNFSNLDNKTYDSILDESISLGYSNNKFAKLFSSFDDSYKLNKIDNFTYDKDILNSIVSIDISNDVIKKLINNNLIDLNSKNIDLGSFFSRNKYIIYEDQKKNVLFDKESTSLIVNPSLIDKDVLNKLYNSYNVFERRTVIDNAAYSIDNTTMNEYVKSMEDKLINNATSDTLIKPYDDLYTTFKEYIDNLKYRDSREEYNKYRNAVDKYKFLLGKMDDRDLSKRLMNIYKEHSLEDALNYIKTLSNNVISNNIIDYHFEENYYNIMIDIKELLRFNYNGNINLSNDKVSLYERIANIDSLSIEEKKELHNSLKNINMVEMFYDDMSFARKIVFNAIKDYSLSINEIKKYKDVDLSNKYGVDVYKIDNKELFAVVKSGTHEEDTLPTGHSYSLIGQNCLSTYHSLEYSDTFVYDSNDINPDQIVHAFPYDSYTFYHPYELSGKGTNKINMLYSPDELLKKTGVYNEILFLEKGSKDMNINKSIPKLNKIALYCLNNITEQDVKSAKESNVGILLVDASNYKKEELDVSDRIGFLDSNYFDGINSLEEFERSR